MTKNFIGNKKKMEPYKGTLIGQTLQARQEQNDILKILNDKKKSAKSIKRYLTNEMYRW